MSRAPIWNCADAVVDLSRPRVMGVLNVTPDSFSDGGAHNDPASAIATASDMLANGADVIDVGGESTRPGFKPVTPKEELGRLEPVVCWLVREGALVSVDTHHPEVARKCVELGAQIVNDVTGFSDPDMVSVAAESSCGCVVMHSGPVSGSATASSAVMAKAGTDDLSSLMSNASAGDLGWERKGDQALLPDHEGVMGLLEGYLLDRARDLEAAGVDPSRICLDPGVGFGKSPEDNIVILRETARLADLGYPLMCAVSRKRFVGTVSGVAKAAERDAATIGITLAAVAQGARVLRVHDVAGMAQALDGFWIASDSWTSKFSVTVAPNDGKPDAEESVASALDKMPLTRVVSPAEAAGKSGSVSLRVVTALDKVPFSRALGTALDGCGATLESISPQ
ncbi:MAG: dihydropteroate synthase [Tractidigestivibacter sp.]|jgi:dihydropteroate synthase|uniref:dihydropteroate synthase n=1 Tax=Tractidigestivibacter sp. TaxID=2847320 RepID=UPI003D8EAD23